MGTNLKESIEEFYEEFYEGNFSDADANQIKDIIEHFVIDILGTRNESNL